jgi:hypothetical protein
MWVYPQSDEGVVGSYGQLIAGGAVPYRDFDLGWNPPEFWLIGAIFRVFGTDYLWLRLASVVAILLTVVLLTQLGSRVLPRYVAALVAAFWGIVVAIHPDISGYHYWEMAAAVGAVAAVLEAHRTAQVRWLVVGAALGTLCYWFVQPFALILPALGLVALVAGFRPRAVLLSGLAGVGLVTVPILGALVAEGSLAQWASQTFWTMFTSYSNANSFPIPWWPLNRYFEDSSLTPEMWVFQYPAVWVYWAVDFLAPLMIAGLLVVASVRRLRIPFPLAALMIVAVAQFAGALIARRDGRMMWVASAVTLVAVAGLLRCYFPWNRPLLRRLIADVLVASFALTFGPAALSARIGCMSPDGVLQQVTIAGRTICAYGVQAKVYHQVTSLVNSHPTDSIAFLPDASALYVLIRRPAPIPFTFLLPGYTSARQYSTAERLLLARHVRWVVYTPFYPGVSSNQLDEFLQRSYTTAAVYDYAAPVFRVTVYRLRDQASESAK